MATEKDAIGTTRIEAFSDGVYAIAITLLIIEVRLPSHDIIEHDGLWHALISLWPSYFAYVLSFIVIGIMWANHHNLFRYIKKANHALAMLNIGLMLGTAFLPFPTAVLAEYMLSSHDQTAAGVFYGATLVFIALFYNLLWRYASYNHRLLEASVDEKIIKGINREYAMGPLLYGLATLVAFFNVWISLAIHAFLAILYLIPNKARP